MNKLNGSYIGLRRDLLKFIIGQDLIVLDVGCATGVNGVYLKDNKIAKWVTGIEFNKEMALIAKEGNDSVFCGDLNSKSFRVAIIEEPQIYDVIIFGDILEHLYDPEVVLRDLTTRLSKNGIVIISLPNIQHIELLIQVYLKGSWPMNERGIFDKTHLRWFTYKDVTKMISKCDLEVKKYDPSYRFRDDSGSKFKFILSVIKFFIPKLFIFQHKMICVKR